MKAVTQIGIQVITNDLDALKIVKLLDKFSIKHTLFS